MYAVHLKHSLSQQPNKDVQFWLALCAADDVGVWNLWRRFFCEWLTLSSTSNTADITGNGTLVFRESRTGRRNLQKKK